MVAYFDSINEFTSKNLQDRWPELSMKIISIARKDRKKEVKDLLLKYDSGKEGLGKIYNFFKLNIC